MKIGIILYSLTGNTRQVAKRLYTELVTKGHDVTLDEIRLEKPEDTKRAGDFKISYSPDPSKYDAVIFAAQVRGFSLSPVMKKYISDLQELKTKSAACLLTEFFPFSWMGGKPAMSQMTIALEQKGADIKGTGIVCWSNINREKMITDEVQNLSSLF